MAAKFDVQIVYYIVNASAARCIFGPFLSDSFIYVQINPRKFIARVADGVVLILLTSVVLFGIGARMGSDLLMQGILPTTEMPLFALPTYLVAERPVLGLICAVIAAPISVSLLYYATAFARSCSHSPLRAYLLMAFILAIPRLINALTFWPWEEEAILYLVQLPTYLLACYTYQKADTIWAPIATHAIVNLIACVVWLLII